MTVVVGGTYAETCLEPERNSVFGSGLRAAVALGSHVEQLVTAADDQSLQTARSLLPRAVVRHSARTRPITFDYHTPLSRPVLTAADDDRNVVLPQADGEHVVVFGTVENLGPVRAKVAVVDPQHSLPIKAINDGINADHIVVVANRHEISTLTGCTDVTDGAADLLHAIDAAHAVVVKLGALGALAFERGRDPVGIPPYPTPTVFPIGSGDVFTAHLAQQLFDGVNLADAADEASQRTAAFVATRQLGPAAVPQPVTVPAPTAQSTATQPIVYVAASFETPEQRWTGHLATAALRDIGADPIYPLTDIGRAEDHDPATIAGADLAAVERADAVLVLADAARSGPHFEAGWATHAGKPVVVVSSDRTPGRFTMLRGTGATVVGDLATGVYHAVWQALAKAAQ